MSVLIREKQQTWGHGRLCDNRQRLGDAPTGQGPPGITGHPQKPGEGYRIAAPSRLPEGTSPADTLNLNFQPREL